MKRTATPATSCLVAPGSLYAINPCSEQAAMVAIERGIRPRLIILELPEQVQLGAGDGQDIPDAPDIAQEGRNALIDDDDDSPNIY